eukprot:CAMPEP_0203667112 /NCGR_PEP_ID=MMETSP0090-20130426/4008_1 /ASSEMBLY_ACC=CAM_ASM_001088 /TAXON_ID=426623 /ORGANISM="Chaetoceros affinis, Strain CCMP159" /LENGTH=464 /DNA_ID=CAMNT_0050531173 /DNA_START=418 /DNA_END=1809 /DNA_ORIENTATION=+
MPSPVVPFGCGTSVEGHVSALTPGSVCLDMKLFKSIGDGYGNDDDDAETDHDDEHENGHEHEHEHEHGDSLKDPCITVGAGVTRLELNEYLRHSGMQFMVDPGADASIGGMVACGASGTTAVKYGTMRDNILSIQCVLPNGTVAKCGTRALKSSAGYDLVSLMTGSEGTLGVITHVTVKLHPIPDCTVAAVCTFDTLYDAAGAVSDMRMCAVDVQRCELLDGRSVEAFVKYTAASNSSSNRSSNNSGSGSGSGSNMEIKPTLFLEFTGPSQTAVEEQVKITESICISSNGSNFQFTADEAERKSLWAARHQLYYASIALRSGADSAIVTDACVPLSAFAQVLTETVKDVEAQGVVGPCFGHAGDGNFHCILPIIGCRDSDSDIDSDSRDSEEYLQKLHLVNDNLIWRTIAAGGTCTGEHGVGYGKIAYLEKQYGKGGVEMMRMIKRGLDPNNIMNPIKSSSLIN